MVAHEGLRLSKPDDTYIGSRDIHAAVSSIGTDLGGRYADAPELRLITVLEGARPFAKDLKAAIDHPNITTDSIKIKSYTSTSTNRRPAIKKDLEHSVEGAATIVIEDIIDSGLTLSMLVSYLKLQRPSSIEVVSLIDKPAMRQPAAPLAVRLTTGFAIANHFVVGYGMDVDGEYRELPFISICDQTAPGLWVPRHKEEPAAA